jgi:hypothetical protein
VFEFKFEFEFIWVFAFQNLKKNLFPSSPPFLLISASFSFRPSQESPLRLPGLSASVRLCFAASLAQQRRQPNRSRASHPACAPLQAAARLRFRPSSGPCTCASAAALADRWDPPVIPYLKSWPSRTPVPPPSLPRARTPTRGPYAKRCARPYLKPSPPP